MQYTSLYSSVRVKIIITLFKKWNVAVISKDSQRTEHLKGICAWKIAETPIFSKTQSIILKYNKADLEKLIRM
jgi:hypothetical protein